MKTIATILFSVWTAAGVFAAGPAWVTDLPQAADQAKKEGKLLLLDFTGSDWCGWCKKLDEETFSKPDFVNFASTNVLLVQLDFPKHKSQPDDLKKANRALEKKYDVHGFPTLFIIKPDGTIMWEQRGYVDGGANAMIDAINLCRRAAGLSTPARPTAPPPPPIVVVPVQKQAPPPEKPPEEPKLQGILYSLSHASAVFDGKSCEEGDFLHGLHVLKIARDEVTVEWLGQTQLLKWMPSQGSIAIKMR